MASSEERQRLCSISDSSLPLAYLYTAKDNSEDHPDSRRSSTGDSQFLTESSSFEDLLRNGADKEDQAESRRKKTSTDSGISQSSNTEQTNGYSKEPMPDSGVEKTITQEKAHFTVGGTEAGDACSYKLLDSHTLPDAVTCLAFCGNDRLAAGCRDSHVYLWNTSDLSLVKKITLSKPAVSVDKYKNHLAIGSDVAQKVDVSVQERKSVIVAADDEPLQNLPLHLVAFAPNGHLVTASVEDNIVKVWPPEQHPVKPLYRYNISKEEGCICSLSVSPSKHNHPFLAVGVQPGKQFRPVGNKQVYLYEWETQKLCCKPFDAGHDSQSNSIHTNFSPDGNFVAIGCNVNLYIWRTEYHDEFKVKGLFSDPISSLLYSPIGNHLSVGLSSGEVQVYDVNSGYTPIFVLKKTENPSAATSLAYSRDGTSFLSGHQSGLLQLWKAANSRRSHVVAREFQKPSAVDEITFCNKPLFTRRGILEVDCRGKEYSSEYDGFKVIVPEGVITKGESISLQHGVVPYAPFHQAPFHYPDGVSPVSSIVWFCPTPEIQFSKPIEITLQHCAECKSEEDCQSLVFLKADHTDVTTSPSGNQIIQFRPADGKAVFLPNTYHGTLHTNHCCHLCVGQYSKEDTDKACYCLITATPHDMMGRGTSDICFCLTFFLDTCIKAVVDQFENYSILPKLVTFSHAQKDPVVKIKFERPKHGGWLVSRSGPKEVPAKDVHFWRRFETPRNLVLACATRIYPPRFTLEVSARNATESVCMEVDFEGPNEDVSTEIQLEYYDPRTPSQNLLANDPHSVRVHVPTEAVLPQNSVNPVIPPSDNFVLPQMATEDEHSYPKPFPDEYAAPTHSSQAESGVLVHPEEETDQV